MFVASGGRSGKGTSREQALAGVDREVLAEKATALCRIGHRLEGFLLQLQQIEQTLPSVRGRDRGELIRAHAEVRKQAELYLWYLVVQREAMGLRQHGDLEDYYPIPPPLHE
jgi:hypothetical protein